MAIFKNKNKIALLLAVAQLFFSVSFVFIDPCELLAQQDKKLEKAQWLYQHENYEEALLILRDLRVEQPQSSEVAYYLGLTYKHLQDFLAAKPHLEAAATLTPSVKNALLELIDLLYQCDRVDETKKWISFAEKESITPAQTAFFKGLVLLKEGKDPQGAINSFEEAQKLDPTLSRTVKYQKGLAYLQLKDFKQAKSIFKEIVVRDPAADLAEYATEFIDVITISEEAAKPFRGSMGYSVQYDDNLILRPDDDTLSAGVEKDNDWKNVYTAQADYTFKPTDNFGLKIGGSFYGTKQNSIGFYDTESYDIPVQPVFYLKKAAIAFPVHYNLVRVDDRNYLSTVGLSNLNNIMFGKNKMMQLQLQYNIKDYHWAPSKPPDSKNGCEYLGSAGWYYFYGKNNEGLVSLRYALNYEDSDGKNYRYYGNRFTLSSVIPVIKKVKLNSALDYMRQDYTKIHSTYTKRRNDNIITVSNLLTYEVVKNTELQLQYTYVYDGASIGAFKYKKNVVGVGVKYRF